MLSPTVEDVKGAAQPLSRPGSKALEYSIMVTCALNHGSVSGCTCPVVHSGEEEESYLFTEYDFTDQVQVQ